MTEPENFDLSLERLGGELVEAVERLRRMEKINPSLRLAFRGTVRIDGENFELLLRRERGE